MNEKVDLAVFDEIEKHFISKLNNNNIIGEGGVGEIKNDEEKSVVVDLSQFCKQINKDLEGAAKAIKQPHLQACQLIDGRRRHISNDIAKVIDQCRDSLDKYNLQFVSKKAATKADVDHRPEVVEEMKEVAVVDIDVNSLIWAEVLRTLSSTTLEAVKSSIERYCGKVNYQNEKPMAGVSVKKTLTTKI